MWQVCFFFQIQKLYDDQVSAIKSVLKGDDVFFCASTGYGKSIVFHCIPLLTDLKQILQIYCDVWCTTNSRSLILSCTENSPLFWTKHLFGPLDNAVKHKLQTTWDCAQATDAMEYSCNVYFMWSLIVVLRIFIGNLHNRHKLSTNQSHFITIYLVKSTWLNKLMSSN